MKILKPLLFTAVLLVASTQVAMAIDLVGLDKDALTQSKTMIQHHNKYIMPAYTALIKNADKALTVKRFSVVDTPLLAASGDPHDFTTMGPYWWPNPATKNGLPYIRKDGELNPQAMHGDREIFNNFARTVEKLGLAYYFTGEEKYAKKSAELLKAWFIDSKTKMNSNLEYSQAIPGKVKGSKIGIIDTQRMPRVLDAIVLISESKALTSANMDAIKVWCTQYLDWLLHGDYAYEITYHPNNHGTDYDSQVTALALFLGDDKVAKAVIKRSQFLRIGGHLGLKGQNFHELERTKPYNYSLFDLELMMAVGQYSKRYQDIDYYHFSVNAASLENAVDFLNGYAFNTAKWTKDGYLGKVEKSPHFERVYLAFSEASRVYGLSKYKDNLYKAWKKDPTNINIVKWPVDFSK